MLKGSLKCLDYSNAKSGYGGDTPCSVLGCANGWGSLKTLPTLQSMARRQLADIFPTNKALLNTPFGDEPSPAFGQHKQNPHLLNTPFGDEPSPLHFRFQAAYCAYTSRQPETVFSIFRLPTMPRSLLQPQFRRPRVRGQTFAVRQHAGDFAERLRALFGNLNQAAAFLEIVCTQGRGEPRGAAGGQHMVGARAVVAQTFAGVASHKDGAGVADFFCPFGGVFHGKFQMLGRDVVGDGAGFV